MVCHLEGCWMNIWVSTCKVIEQCLGCGKCSVSVNYYHCLLVGHYVTHVKISLYDNFAQFILPIIPSLLLRKQILKELLTFTRAVPGRVIISLRALWCAWQCPFLPSTLLLELKSNPGLLLLYLGPPACQWLLGNHFRIVSPRFSCTKCKKYLTTISQGSYSSGPYKNLFYGSICKLVIDHKPTA